MIRKLIPWQAKIAIKLILARLPVPYGIWSKLNLFKHGRMEQENYAKKIFTLHVGLVVNDNLNSNGVYLEMGTGDSVAAGIYAKANGASRTYLIDVGDYATRNMNDYTDIIASLDNLPPLPPNATFDDMLEIYDIVYKTHGLQSLHEVPDDSVDFIWSHATLEHVRRSEFQETMNETRRILKPTGVISHNVDLKDHLGGALNNLRFSESLWEKDWFAQQSGFYTNRLQSSDIKSAMEKSGLKIEHYRIGQWENLPTSRDKMDNSFKEKQDQDLMIRSVQAILKKTA